MFETILRLVPVLCTACSIDLLSEERTEDLAKCIVDVSNAYFTDGDTLLYLSPIKDLSTKGRSVADVLYKKFRHLDLPLEPQETCLSTRKLLSVDKLEDWDTAEYNEYLEHYLLTDYECNITYESSKTKYVDTQILRSLHEDSKWPIILQPYGDGWYTFSGIVKGYILTIQKNESLSNIENFCLMFDYSPALSKDSNILVIVLGGWLEEFEVYKIMNVFVKRHIHYIILLCYNKNDTFNIFTWSKLKKTLFGSDVVDSLNEIGKCSSTFGLIKDKSWNLSKDIVNMEGRPFIHRSQYNPPFSMPFEKEGMAFRLVGYIAKNMNSSFTGDINLPSRDFHSFHEYYDIDISVLNFDLPSLFQSGKRRIIFFYTLSYVWFVRTAQPYDRWTSMFRVFTVSNWLLIFFTLLITAIIFSFIKKSYQSLESCVQGFHVSITEFSISCSTTKCILEMWSVLLGIGVFDEPTKVSLRILLLIWIVFSLSINTIYQSFVVSYFLDPGSKHQIDTLNELIERNYTLAFDSFRSLLQYANDKRATLYVTSEVYNQEDTFLQSMSQVFNIPNSALLFSEELFDYFTQKYCGSGLLEKYHKFTTKSHQEHIFVNVINPLIRSRFSTLMQRLVQGGFPEKIMRDVTDPCGRFAFMTPKVGIDNYVQMSLSHFKSSMIVYVTGIILAGAAFIWEMVIDVRFSTGIRDYHSNAKSLFDARAN